MMDKEVLKALFSSEDLESLVCCQRELNFNELKDTVVYGNGFNPDQPMIKWFWDIVLNEWDDEKRRKLLSFTTGSDRAPVNGLKSLKFFIIREDGDDQKLPSSHTCFNQLCLPVYSSKDILRNKLLMAIENSTGFGMV